MVVTLQTIGTEDCWILTLINILLKRQLQSPITGKQYTKPLKTLKHSLDELLVLLLFLHAFDTFKSNNFHSFPV